MTEKKNKKKAKDVVAEASEKPSSAEKKTPKSLKPGRKIKKKSPSKSVSEAKVATGALPIQGIKDKQSKKTESNGIEGTNKAEGHEDEKPKINVETKEKILKEVSGKDQPENNKDECHESEKNLENPKNKEKLGGLIFMCSAKTKPDCFHYHVMGVSASKKDLVLSVKPGLKLFLYDFDLKLMYGIYKASSSGGMKLEPEAFNGAFPVQVRFTVHMDCYPLPESIFKKAIKDNYDKTNKFRTELTVEQVKKLTKLFRPSEIHSKEPRLDSPPRARAREHDRDVYRGKGESRPHSRSTRGDHNASGDARSLSRLSRERYQPIAHREIAGSDRFPNDVFMSEKEYRTYGLQGGSIRGDARSYTVLSQQRPSSPRVEEFPPPSFMSEKEYRTYGLRRATRNTSPPAHEQERLVRHQAPVYLDVAGGEDHVGKVPLVNELGYRAQGLHARQGLPSSILPATANPADALVERGYHIRNPATTHREPLQHGGEYLTSHRSARHESLSSIPAAGTVASASAYARDPYARTGGSYALIRNIDQVQMREADTLERIYATYASDPPSRYDERHHYQEATKEPGRVPVSSLYSFAGPSYRP